MLGLGRAGRGKCSCATAAGVQQQSFVKPCRCSRARTCFSSSYPTDTILVSVHCSQDD